MTHDVGDVVIDGTTSWAVTVKANRVGGAQL